MIIMFIGFYLVPMEFKSHMKQYFKNIVLNMGNCSLEFINENILIIYARQRVYKKRKNNSTRKRIFDIQGLYSFDFHSKAVIVLSQSMLLKCICHNTCI